MPAGNRKATACRGVNPWGAGAADETCSLNLCGVHSSATLTAGPDSRATPGAWLAGLDRPHDAPEDIHRPSASGPLGEPRARSRTSGAVAQHPSRSRRSECGPARRRRVQTSPLSRLGKASPHSLHQKGRDGRYHALRSVRGLPQWHARSGRARIVAQLSPSPPFRVVRRIRQGPNIILALAVQGQNRLTVFL